MNKPTTLCPTHGKFPTQCGCSDEQIRRVLQEALPDKQKPVPSLSVTEAHPKEERLAEIAKRTDEELWRIISPDMGSGETYALILTALKEASSEPVNPSRQNARKLASKIVGAVLRELLARRAIVRELELAEDEVRAEVERTLTEKAEKVILSSQPNEEQSTPPVTQTPSMEGANKQ